MTKQDQFKCQQTWVESGKKVTPDHINNIDIINYTQVKYE
jgi:hypothetical protein